jgi:hypothetical protein
VSPRACHPLDGRRAHPGGLGHAPTAPMRLPLGLGVLGQPHDLIDGLLGDLVLSPSAGAHLGELGQPVLAKAGAPRPHRDSRYAHLVGYQRVGHPLTGQQQHLGPEDLLVSGRFGPGDGFQGRSLALGQLQRGGSCS